MATIGKLRFYLATLTCLTMILSVGNASAEQKRIPTSFWWYYNATPKGWRYWSMVDNVTWIEKYDKTESRFHLIKNTNVYGCDGLLLAKEDKSLESFVPDSACTSQDLLFRMTPAGQDRGKWSFLSFLQDIKYDKIPASSPPPPANVGHDPGSDLIDSITAASQNPPKDRTEHARAIIKVWALSDALLGHCGIDSNFLGRARASAKRCLSSDQLDQAIDEFVTTKDILQRYFDVGQVECTNNGANSVLKTSKKRLESAMEIIKNKCG